MHQNTKSARLIVVSERTLIALDVSKPGKCLSEKRLCFNCTGADHRASECRSRSGCSICDNPIHLLRTATSATKGSTIYPVVMVKVNGGGFNIRQIRQATKVKKF